MGAFAEIFGIRPWEWYQLTVSETRALEGYIRQRDQAIKDASSPQ